MTTTVKTWGDFELYFDRPLGKGGMGTVYMGRQVSLDRPAALKVLKRELTENPDFVKRFHREAALLARLVDAHVVQVFGAGEAEGQHYFAMEYVEGETLAVRLERGHKFSVEEILKAASQIGQALQAGWQHHIVHRDIKPSNILITKDGLMKVMDFGLAKNPEQDLTRSEIIIGTVKYMSPEQATGSPVDIRSDLYSLGVVLYELATGGPPFRGESATAVMYQHVHESPKPPRELNPDIPQPIQSFILRLLAKAPEDRYTNPDEMLAHLKSIVDGVTSDDKSTLYKDTVFIQPATSKTQAATTPPPEETKPQSTVALYASLLVTAILLGVGGYALFSVLNAEVTGPDTGGVVPTPPPPPVENGAPPPEAKPWEQYEIKGMEAFDTRQWKVALGFLELARQKGAPGLAAKIDMARGRVLIEQGDRQADIEQRLASYLEAKQFIGEDEGLKKKIAAARFNLSKELAEKHESNERWAQAGAEWSRALEAAVNEKKVEILERQRFADTFAKAIDAQKKKEWRIMLKHYLAIRGGEGKYADRIELAIAKARTEVARMDKEIAGQLRKEFDALIEDGGEKFGRAEWEKARATFLKTRDKKFERFPRDEAERYLVEVGKALAPPPGMIYVMAGKFPMGGGGQEVAEPAGEAGTGAFYLDVREVTAAEYAQFLLKMEGQNHHPACHKDEPETKKNHTPERWRNQEANAPVSGVDWWDAYSYAAWRGKRLPMEVEWEKGASFDPAGKRPYPWGGEYRVEGGKSFFGCEGMGGGVLEWTADWLDKYPWNSANHSDFGKKKRVLRGGIQLKENAETDSLTTHRKWFPPSYRSYFTGIRCARDAAGH